MKRNLVIILFIMLIAGVIGNAVTRGNRKRVSRKKIGNVKVSEKTVDLSNYDGIKKISIFVQGFESGPAVSKIILEMTDFRITNLNKNDWKIKTNRAERKVKDIYVSDKKGEKAFDTGVVTLELENVFNQNTLKYEGTPFTYNREKFFNEWTKEYIVEIEGKITVNGKDYLVNKKENVINNRVSTDTELFNYRSSFTGNYKNPITKKMENLKLEMAAYEPENFKLGAKKPLIVWLHGQGEGGTDPDIDILGTETSALAKNEKIQKMKKTPVWFIAAADDGIVTPQKFSLPTYRDLLKAGADNAWYSYYENVTGTDEPNSRFPGHFSWIYFLNNQVEGVQNRDKIKNSKDETTFGFEPSNAGKGGSEKAQLKGKTFENVFEWMNFQKKVKRK